MTTRELALTELAERCEKATGPGVMLTQDIADYAESIGLLSIGMRIPDYSSSLDAAMTLLPEGWWLQHLGWKLDGWSCLIETNGPPSRSADVGRRKGIATPALALCVAALRARALKDSVE